MVVVVVTVGSVGMGVSPVLVRVQVIVLILILALTSIVPEGCHHSVHYQYVLMVETILRKVVSCITKSAGVFDDDEEGD